MIPSVSVKIPSYAIAYFKLVVLINIDGLLIARSHVRQPGDALLAAQLAENIMPSTGCMMIAPPAADCHCLVCDGGFSRSLPEVASQIHLRQPGNCLVIAELVDDIVHIHI